VHQWRQKVEAEKKEAKRRAAGRDAKAKTESEQRKARAAVRQAEWQRKK
jgi:hypothetical protein